MSQDRGLPGDVVLYTATGKSALSSRLVAAGEILAGFGRGFEQYSHGAVLDVDGWQWEAVFPRADRTRVDQSRPYEVWRFGDPSSQQRGLIVGWCRAHRGALYDLVGVLTAGVLHLPGTYYCTRWCGEAYKAAGIGIGDEIMSPDSLPDTPGARKVYSYVPR